MRLSAVKDIVAEPGPYVTVHAEVGRASENPRQQLDARWTTIRHALDDEDVSGEVVERIGEKFAEPPATYDEAFRTIVATRDRVLFDDTVPGDSPVPEGVESALLPDLGPWLAAADGRAGFALAICDKEGGDVSWHRSSHDAARTESEAGGRTLHEHKVGAAVGEPQYQRHSEETWQANAKDVASQLRSLSHRAGTRAVVLAGDPRIRSEVADELDEHHLPVVEVESGNRAEGSSPEVMWGEIEEALAAVVAREESELVDRLGAGEGQAGATARGLEPVLESFVNGQVATLLVDLDEAREHPVDVRAYPGLPLPEGVTGSLPADRVLLAVAATTDADVVHVQAARMDGPVAALLRWDG